MKLTDIESSEEETDIESSEETKLETIEEKVITISAVNLYRDYEANEVAADKDYKGKVVEVTGVVESISKDLFDKIYVSLKGDGYSVQLIVTLLMNTQMKLQIYQKDKQSVTGDGSLTRISGLKAPD